MDQCFGKGDPELRKRCDCPPACKRLCKDTHHHQRYSPISLGAQGQTKPYTKIPNELLRPWEHELYGDPPASTKLIYLFLLTFTRHDKKRKDTRWIRQRIGVLAERFFGTPSKAKRRTFEDHLRKLKDYGMIELVPFDLVDPGHKSAGGKEKSIIINDLPGWWPNRDSFRQDRPSGVLPELLDEDDDMLSDAERRDQFAQDEVTEDQIDAANKALQDGKKRDKRTRGASAKPKAKASVTITKPRHRGPSARHIRIKSKVRRPN